MFSNADRENAYRFSGMTWNELLIPNESSKSINCGQKFNPADVSTSCVSIVQLGDPSGQYQMKGTRVTVRAFMESAKSCSKILSTVVSTGHFGNGVLSQFRKYTL
jgi:hypothetical protein